MNLRKHLLREWSTGLRIKSYGLVEINHIQNKGKVYSGIDEKRGLCFGFGVNKVVFSSKKKYGIIIVEYYQDKKHGTILLLSCRDTGLSEPFSLLCNEIYSVKNIEEEHYLERIDDILREWYELFGGDNKNKGSSSIVTGLIGELLFLKKALDVKDTAGLNWQGPESSINDFRFGKNSVEIKTTTLRNAEYIEAHGIHQFQVFEKEKLILGYCRLEKVKSGGFSVETLIGELKKIIPDILLSEIENILSEINNEFKNQLYRELEFRIYNVNKSFPRLSLESFKDDSIPYRLSNFRYQINLSGLPSKSLKEWIKYEGVLFIKGE